MQTYAILVKSDREYNTSAMKAKVLKYFKEEKIKCFKTNHEAIEHVSKGTYFEKTYNSHMHLISHDAIKTIVFNSQGGLFFITVPDAKKANNVVNELILNLNCTVLCEEFDNSYFEPTGSKYKKTVSYIHMKLVEHQSARYEAVHYLFKGNANYNELGIKPHDELVKFLKDADNVSYNIDYYSRIAKFIRLVYELNNDPTNY